MTHIDYDTFLRAKIKLAESSGFDLLDDEINCPMQFDIADRIIERFTNKGNTVLDPFSGIGSVGYRAILKGRKYVGVELSTRYFMDSAHYLKSAEDSVSMPSLFDSIEEVA